MDRRAYYLAFYETPAQKLVRACAAAVLAWMLQSLLVIAALALRSVARAEAVPPDRIVGLAALAAACAWLAWRLHRRTAFDARRQSWRSPARQIPHDGAFPNRL